MSKDSEVWKNEANELFKKGKFEQALFLYDRGIRCNPDSPILYLDKSLTCLKIDSFYMAYESAKIGLEKGGDREKALFRSVKLLLYLIFKFICFEEWEKQHMVCENGKNLLNILLKF